MKIDISINKVMVALLLIGIGVGVLLDNFNVIQFDIGDLFRIYWPLIPIYIGLKTIFDGFKKNRFYSGSWIFHLPVGLIIALIGWNFLAKNLGFNAINLGSIWNFFWPLILILIGLKMLFRNNKKPFIEVIADQEKVYNYEEYVTGKNEDRYVDDQLRKKRKVYKSSIIGDLTMGKEISDIDELHLWHGIGDIDIDLSKAILSDGEIQISVAGWIGDVDIFVPKELPVQIITNVRIGESQIFDQFEGGLKRNSYYKSFGYDEAYRKVLIKIDLKIGDVRIKEV
jgi:lia operon protein LiaF